MNTGIVIAALEALQADSLAYGDTFFIVMREGALTSLPLGSNPDPEYLRQMASQTPSIWIAYKAKNQAPVYNMPVADRMRAEERAAYNRWLKASADQLNQRFSGKKGDVSVEDGVIARISNFLRKGRFGQHFTQKELTGGVQISDDQTASLAIFVDRTLDPIRVKAGRAVEVVRGYTTAADEVELLLGFHDEHAMCRAADIKVKGWPSARLAALLINDRDIPFDRLVCFHPAMGGHLHVSLALDSANRNLLQICEQVDGEIVLTTVDRAEMLKLGGDSTSAVLGVEGNRTAPLGGRTSIDVPAIRNEDRAAALKDGRLVHVDFPTAGGVKKVVWAAKYADQLAAAAKRLGSSLQSNGITAANYPNLARDLLADYGVKVDWSGPTAQLVRTFDGSHNFRPTRSNPKVLSQHSMATALDLNAAKNPMVDKAGWTSKDYQRALWNEVFSPAGFGGWGGLWRTKADDMHFGIVNA